MSVMTEPATSTTPDFTKPREPRRFRLGGVDYAAPAIISAVTLRKAIDLANRWRQSEHTDPTEGINAVGEGFALLLPGNQGLEIQHRITSDEDNPIDLSDEALPAFTWLMGQYGLRPTQQSSPSANGSTTPTTPNEPTSSTDGASVEASTNGA